MKNFYRFMGLLSVFNTVNHTYRGNYGLALVSLMCFVVFALNILHLVRKENDYISIKEWMEKGE